MKGSIGTPMVEFSPFKTKNEKDKKKRIHERVIQRRKKACASCFYHKPFGYCSYKFKDISKNGNGRVCEHCTPTKGLTEENLRKLENDLQKRTKQYEINKIRKFNDSFNTKK